MIEQVIIKSEDDAFAALQKALAQELDENTQVVFEGWPVFRLTISGEDFDSSIPTRIMPPILDLQRELYRIYCKARYNSEDTKRLTQDERELLELVVTVERGSSAFITELANSLNEIVKNSNMSGDHALILLVSVAVLITASYGWRDWLRKREREHGQEITVRLSEQETRRLELVTEAMRQKPELVENQGSIDRFRSDLSKKLKPADQIAVDSQPIITGVRAAEIVPTPRAAAEDLRIDGEFVINEVKFPRVFGGKYRFSVTRVIDQQHMMVDAQPGVLTDEQLDVLKEGGFGVRPVLMEINAKSLRGYISSASLVSIRWPEVGGS